MHARASNTIDISRLRNFALDTLPPESPLREVLAAEANELRVDVFLARLPIWLRLSTLQKDGRRNP